MSESIRKKLLRPITTPVFDVLGGLDRCLDRGMLGLVMIFVGLFLGWWLYVPVHELFHAWGCLLAGGEVTRLEIDPLYGGAILAAWIPWVAAGSDYAGQLVGFDTYGNDWIYIVTVVAPFVLTLFPGVFLLRWCARRRSPIAWGATLPWALAPFLSLTGDAYELGSILITRVAPWASEIDAIRGDDVFLLAAEWSGATMWSGGLIACAIAVVWAFATYGLGGWLATCFGATPLTLPAARPSNGSDANRSPDDG
ncbi:MAG: hypothetical protein AAGD38_04750 [Acidobacteriota bacterium]